jgi:hypothetical protein
MCFRSSHRRGTCAGFSTVRWAASGTVSRTNGIGGLVLFAVLGNGNDGNRFRSGSRYEDVNEVTVFDGARRGRNVGQGQVQ